MSTILVAGGSGYVGSVVVPRLVEAGHTVRVLTRGTRRTELPAAAQSVLGDIAAGEGLDAAIQGCDVVVSLVAIIVERGSQTFARVNAQGSANLAAAAAKAGSVQQYIHVSALGVRPDPRFGYLSSKWAGEQAVTQSGLNYTIIRPSIIFGPGKGEHFISILADLLGSPVVPVPGSGRTLFQPVSVEDLAECLVKCVGNAQTSRRIYEIGGPEQFSYNQVLTQVGAALGKAPIKLHIPLLLMKPMVALMERILPRPPVTSDQLRALAIDNVTNNNALPDVFSITPRSLPGGLGYLTTH